MRKFLSLAGGLGAGCTAPLAERSSWRDVCVYRVTWMLSCACTVHVGVASTVLPDAPGESDGGCALMRAY